jgi:hypothetical protein
MLQAAWKEGRDEDAWQIWEALQSAWQHTNPQTAYKQGYAPQHRYAAYRTMSNGLARHNHLVRATLLLRQLAQDSATWAPFYPPHTKPAHHVQLDVQDFATVYVKSFELDDPKARYDLLSTCTANGKPSGVIPSAIQCKHMLHQLKIQLRLY